MVCCSAVYTCSASGHSVYNIFIRNFYIDGIIHLLSHCRQSFIQCLCLWDCSRETIQHISFGTVFLIYPVYHEVNYQFIRYKKSLIHICFCFLSKLCSVFNIGSENITCRNMRNIIFLCNFLSLCSFSCSRSTQHNNLHNSIPPYSTLTRRIPSQKGTAYNELNCLISYPRTLLL